MNILPKDFLNDEYLKNVILFSKNIINYFLFIFLLANQLRFLGKIKELKNEQIN